MTIPATIRQSPRSLTFAYEPATDPASEEQRAAVLAAPGFGKTFTDHMVTIRWTAAEGWHDALVGPYGPFQLQPSSAVFHYGQAIFEGYKAYRHADDSIWSFRPEANGRRFARSAERLALPVLPVAEFVAAGDALIAADRAWVPAGGEASLYLRPFMMGTEAFLGVRPAQEVLFSVIASPAGPYFARGLAPVSIWLSEHYTRAAPGGTGAAKCGGNYAASLLPQQEAIAHGCDQVVFLDAVERTWIEELGGMNVYFVLDDGTLVTPELTGTLLEGVTRDSILALAGELGHKIEERRISIDEWREGVATGRITEAFACGTAAVVTPMGRLAWDGGELDLLPGGEVGPVTNALRRALLDVQQGVRADEYGWLHRSA